VCGLPVSGDALGIYPQNCSEDVDEIMKLAGWKDSELVDVPPHAYQPVSGTISAFSINVLLLVDYLRMMMIVWRSDGRLSNCFVL